MKLLLDASGELQPLERRSPGRLSARLAFSPDDRYTFKMAIYTRKGDGGETDLLGGVRVPKDAARLEACGELDELDAVLGLVRCERLPEEILSLLEQIQHRMIIGRAELVCAGSVPLTNAIGPTDVEQIERAIDRHGERLPSLAAFIIPGGCRAAAVLQVARAVCRRAERRLVALSRLEQSAVSPSLLAYVNRLSDLFFVLARYANARAGVADNTC